MPSRNGINRPNVVITFAFFSQVHCSESASLARFCLFENVAFDFSKMMKQKRSGRSDSRTWKEGFLSSHCAADKNAKAINFYEVDLEC
jgi:hypothetical protein